LKKPFREKTLEIIGVQKPSRLLEFKNPRDYWSSKTLEIIGVQKPSRLLEFKSQDS
jgi:predicted P-loop ATPase/GTPase